MALRATRVVRAGLAVEPPWIDVTLDSLGRHLRRRLVALPDGGDLLVDLEQAVQLRNGDCLALEDGRLVRIVAAAEDLMEVRGDGSGQLARLAWHIGNRHLEAQIEADRILIRRDRVIAHMLAHQGAAVREVRETFAPESGAYHAHSHGAPDSDR